MVESEVWKVVPEFPLFEVSSLGRARRGDRILRGSVSPKGYVSIVTYPGPKHPNGRLKPVRFSVHRAVCRAFNGPVDELKATTLLINVAHLNGNPQDNRASNLAWVTAKENSSHRIIHGTHQQGEQCSFARLRESDIRKIRQRAGEGERHPTIAIDFGISREHVRDIASRRRWKHVT